MSQLSDDRNAELRELFFESALELLQSLNEDALKLEKEPGDVEIVRSIRRTVHTLKGDAAACGFRELSEAAHELEDALAIGVGATATSLPEIAFTAADSFGAMVASYRQNVSPPSAEPLRKLVGRLLAKQGESRDTHAAPVDGKAALASASFVPTEEEQRSIDAAIAGGRNVYSVSAQIDPRCAMPIAARQLILVALSELGDVLGERQETGNTGNKRLWFWLACHVSQEKVAGKCRIPTVTAAVKVEVVLRPSERAVPVPVPGGAKAEDQAGVSERGGAPHAAVEGEATAKTPQAQSGSADNILRVDAERIDNVLNLVGELIIGKSMLQQSLQELGKRYPREALRGRLSDALAFQARVLNDLQRSVMTIRMVPVEQLFRRFPRMVRDVAKQCERKVELAISGQDTDLDKSLLDAISEPLTHLVRNAIGHGIEPPAERTRIGKPAHGTIRLNAYHQGNQVIIEASDDGRGIDVQRVRAKAIQQGLITVESAAALSDAEALELIFRPGFSTAERITEVAGRGVGLDVVQSVLHRLKGVVEIDTQIGKGTTFRLKLPLTLAIIKALLFRIEQRLYAVPLNSVAEITRARESDLHQVGSYEVLQLRTQSLSLVRLGRPPADSGEKLSNKIFVLVISVGDRRLGLIVDSLEGEEELVIKALDDQTMATDLVSGASILGDGRVVLILNLAAIVERASREKSTESRTVQFGLLLTQADRARFAAQGQAPLAQAHTGGQS